MADYKKARKYVDNLEYNGNYKLALHDVKGDKGGLTYKGIAKNYHPNWKGWGLIEKLGRDPKKQSNILWNTQKDIRITTKCLAFL